MKKLTFLIIITFSLSCKKDLITESQNSDIKELYFLKNSNPPTKRLVKSYEIKNTPDTYYLEKSAEVGLRFYYDSKGNIVKYYNYLDLGAYKYNDLGLPILKYKTTLANQIFIEKEFFYNHKNLILKINEFFEYDKSFLRQKNYNYDIEGKLLEYNIKESNTVLNNYSSVLFRTNMIISTYNNSRDTVTINSQNLPIKIWNSQIRYTVKENVVTIEELNNNNSIISYVIVEFDSKNKPSIPNYIEPAPFNISKLLYTILDYSDRNPIKITYFDRRNNSIEWSILEETTFTYKYDSQNYPIEILRRKSIFNYGQSSTTVNSNQIIKIEYE